MKNSEKLAGKALDNFLIDLSQLAESLPSQKEVIKLGQELNSLIRLLKDFQKQFEEIPDSAETDKIIVAIEQLRDLIRVAESDPDLSCALNSLSRKSKARLSRQRPSTGSDIKKAKMVANQLKEMSTKEVYKKFEDRKAFPVATLRQIADELGVMLPSKSTRTSIVEQISKTVSNRRGYNYLRYGSNKRL